MTYVDVITSINIKKRLLKITKSLYKDTSSVVCMKRRIDDAPEFPYNSRSKSRLSPFASPLQFVPWEHRAGDVIQNPFNHLSRRKNHQRHALRWWHRSTWRQQQQKKVRPRTHLQTRPTRKHAWEKANSWLIKNLPTTTLPWMETEWKKLRLSISLCQQPLQRKEDQQLRSEWDSGNSRNDQTQKIMEMQKEHLSNKSQTTRRRWSQEIKLSKISTYSSQNTEANTLLGNL